MDASETLALMIAGMRRSLETLQQQAAIEPALADCAESYAHRIRGLERFVEPERKAA